MKINGSLLISTSDHEVEIHGKGSRVEVNLPSSLVPSGGSFSSLLKFNSIVRRFGVKLTLSVNHKKKVTLGNLIPIPHLF